MAVIAVLTQRAQTRADSYASTDYASGGVRAWALLLQREGIRTQRFVRRPVELDANTDTLISIAPLPFAAAPGARTNADIADLAAWVRRGGRLVYVGRLTGARGSESSELKLPPWLPGAGTRGALRGPFAARIGTLAALGPDRMLARRTRARSELADGGGDIVARYALGKGEVVAVGDAAPLTNGAIALAGNARLAFLIGRPRHAGGTVAFDDGIHGALIDRPWYRALPAPVLLALAIGALAAVAGTLGAMLRGGPPVTLRRAREPTSAEFVAALAALYARANARGDARALLAADAFALAARSIGAPAGIAPDDLAARIANRRGGAAVAALAADLRRPVNTDDDLVASARRAYDVRKDIIHGGNGDGGRTAFRGGSRTRRRR